MWSKEIKLCFWDLETSLKQVRNREGLILRIDLEEKFMCDARETLLPVNGKEQMPFWHEEWKYARVDLLIQGKLSRWTRSLETRNMITRQWWFGCKATCFAWAAKDQEITAVWLKFDMEPSTQSMRNNILLHGKRYSITVQVEVIQNYTTNFQRIWYLSAT